MRIFLSAVVVALLVMGGIAGFSNPVSAGTKRILTVGPGIADSDCVGETSSPVCAVETWLACRARRDAELCARVTPQLEILFDPEVGQFVFEYQISAVQVILRKRITKGLADYGVEPGDVEIRLRVRARLYKDENFITDLLFKESYFLSPRNGNWIIVAWTDENAPESCGGTWEYANQQYYRQCNIFIYEAEEPWVHGYGVEYKME